MDTDKILSNFGYTVVKNIGGGVHSKVMLANSKRHPNLVAIKIMDLEGKSPTFTSQFLPRELEILKRAKHPHIVQMHEIVEIPNRQVYIVMEPAKIDLLEKIKMDDHIPIHLAKEWFSQLLSAIDYLHQQDIVHRDLKCENVLLTSDSQVKLTDFGFGRFSKGFPDLSDTFCSTPIYSAPEVLLRKPYDPKKGDVWSLGVILYIMLTGELPYKADHWRKLPNLQRQPLKFPPNSSIEEPCRDLICSILNHYPRARPSVTQLAQHPWLQSRRGIIIGRFVVAPVHEDEGCSSEPDTNPSQKDDSGEADARSRTCRNVGVRFSRLCAAVKRGCRSLQKRMKKFFRLNPVVPDSSPSQQGAANQAPATSLAQACRNAESQLDRPEVEKECDLSQPTERHEMRTQHKFRWLKILKKKKRILAF